MSYRPVFQAQSAWAILVIILLAFDLSIRFWSATPVEATRISGRETDEAFHSLSGANDQLASSNQKLASSLDRLGTILQGLDIKKLSDSQTKLAESQLELVKTIKVLNEALMTYKNFLSAPISAPAAVVESATSEVSQ
jgi:hypothetical protein